MMAYGLCYHQLQNDLSAHTPPEVLPTHLSAEILHSLHTLLLKNFGPLATFQTNPHRLHIKMPRMVAPPPSGEFQIVLSKPFNGEFFGLTYVVSHLRDVQAHQHT